MGWQIKAIEYAIIMLLVIVFSMAVVTGHVINQTFFEAKVSALQPTTLLAMNLGELSNVNVLRGDM